MEKPKTIPMTGDTNTHRAAVDTLAWPEGLTRVPYWAFQREDVYRNEQQRIFQGKCWNYLCLEVDIPIQEISARLSWAMPR